MSSVFARMLALLCLLASTLAQGQALVTARANNGLGGVFLDLQPNNGPLAITGFDTPVDGAAGVNVSVEVWVRSGSYAGFTASSAGWTLSQTATGVTQGNTVNTPFALTAPIVLAPGQVTAVYLHAVTPGTGLRYTGSSSNPPQTTWSNTDLTLFSDQARIGNVAFEGSPFAPRTFSGAIRYTHALPTAPDDNGSGGVFLDLQAVDQPLTVTGFDVRLGSVAGTATSFEVWTRSGTYAGHTGNDTGWTLTQTIGATSAGNAPAALTRILLRAPIRVSPSEATAVYLHSTTLGSGIRYTGTAGSPPQTLWSNADLTLFSDVVRTGNASFDGNQFSPRTFSGSVLYSKAFQTAPSNNGDGGIFLDLQPVDGGVNLTGFEVPLEGVPDTPVSIEVWVRPGSYAGFTDSNDGWTLRQTISGVSQGSATPTPFLINPPLRLQPDQTTAVYLHSLAATAGIRYTNTRAQTPAIWSNFDLVLSSDVARAGAVPFGGGLFTPRTFSGVLRYTTDRVFEDGFESH